MVLFFQMMAVMIMAKMLVMVIVMMVKKYSDGDGDAGKEDGDGDGDGGIRSGCERTDVAKGKVSGESATDSCEN